MKEMWIIRFNDRDGEPAWWSEENGKREPNLHETQKDAVKASLNNFISSLSSQYEDLDNDSREPDEVDFEHDEVVEKCFLYDDGKITTEDGEVLYKPNPNDIPEDLFRSPTAK